MSLAVIISETKVLLNDIELQLSRSSCSWRPRLEHVINQPVAGFAVVAERDLIRVLGKYAKHNRVSNQLKTK